MKLIYMEKMYELQGWKSYLNMILGGKAIALLKYNIEEATNEYVFIIHDTTNTI